jgi:hypothetical protein
MSIFSSPSLTNEDYWRAIILFGGNSATYKFALAKSLSEFVHKQQSFIRMEELAVPFSQHLCEHLKSVEKQSTSKSSKFLDVCREYNAKVIDHDTLINATVKRGFENVIKAFHVVNQDKVGVPFYQDDRKAKKGITLTDAALSMLENFQFQNLSIETEARWRLVETAWSQNVSPKLLQVQHDNATNELYIAQHGFKRTNITSSRDALNGYQKGKCFYSFHEISVVDKSPNLADVDHLFPHKLKPDMPDINFDGIWNLVLSTKDCNRGENGKFAKLVEPKYLERLHERNNYLIESHHPLRETLINQTGKTEPIRRNFLQSVYNAAAKVLLQTWKPEFEHDDRF